MGDRRVRQRWAAGVCGRGGVATRDCAQRAAVAGAVEGVIPALHLLRETPNTLVMALFTSVFLVI